MKQLDFALIGSKIRERRRSLGLTQEYIAEYLDVNPSHLSNIESGKCKVSLTALVSIANVLESSVDYFLLEQYSNQDKILDSELLNRISKYDKITKEKILKIMDVL